jgi:type III restriction enzyme
MSSFEVPEPIQNPPFEEPTRYWYIREGEQPELRTGRRPPIVFPPRDQREPWNVDGRLLRASKDYPAGFELALVSLIRERVEAWRTQGYPGVMRTTDELLRYWTREGREKRLFYAQIEAAQTVIFLREARSDFLQGISVPRDEPGESVAPGFSPAGAALKGGATKADAKGFLRYACKMATGAGKTAVMGMIAAWSILNKVNDRSDGRFSDIVLVVCPNVTIRRPPNWRW